MAKREEGGVAAARGGGVYTDTRIPEAHRQERRIGGKCFGHRNVCDPAERYCQHARGGKPRSTLRKLQLDNCLPPRAAFAIRPRRSADEDRRCTCTTNSRETYHKATVRY